MSKVTIITGFQTKEENILELKDNRVLIVNQEGKELWIRVEDDGTFSLLFDTSMTIKPHASNHILLVSKRYRGCIE